MAITFLENDSSNIDQDLETFSNFWKKVPGKRVQNGKWVPLKIKMDLLSTKSLERTNIIIVCYLFLLFGVRS